MARHTLTSENCLHLYAMFVGKSCHLFVLQYCNNSYCQTHFQILPSITESSYYLSSLLSPVSSCVAVNLSFNYVGKMKTTRNILLYTLYSLIAIVCAFAPITFDLRIVLHYFTSYFILMYFYSRMSTGISAFQFKEE